MGLVLQLPVTLNLLLSKFTNSVQNMINFTVKVMTNVKNVLSLAKLASIAVQNVLLVYQDFIGEKKTSHVVHVSQDVHHV